MGKGRPRKPDVLKILGGSYRADRAAPPVPPAKGSPEPPDDLEGAALAFWKAVVPGLVASRVAGAADSPMLALMCEWWAMAKEQMKLAKGGDKCHGVAAQCFAAFDKIACRFGLTPSDRAKLRVSPESAPRTVASRKRGG